MITVFICGLINSGMLLGLLAGLIVGFIEARIQIAAALRHDPYARPVTTGRRERPMRAAAAPA